MFFSSLFFINKRQSLIMLHFIPSLKWSYWPFCLAWLLGCFLFNQILWFYDFTNYHYIFWINSFWPIYIEYTEFTYTLFFCSNLFLIFVIYAWIHDFFWEVAYSGRYMWWYRNVLKGAFLLFLLSEIFFFVAIFWAFFHASLHPTWAIGEIWPPKGIIIISPYTYPLYNTILLLCSGTILSRSILALYEGKRDLAGITLFATICCGIFFTWIQIQEYISCYFSINDSIYGSIFFFATGTHGIHVILGTIFLICLFYCHCLGVNGITLPILGAWYWHFVDLVWIFVYLFIYLWGSCNIAYWPF